MIIENNPEQQSLEINHTAILANVPTNADEGTSPIDESEESNSKKININFRVASVERRNVNKSIVRYILINYKKWKEEIIREMKNNTMTDLHYECVSEQLANLRVMEKSPENKRKDYAKVLYALLGNPAMLIITKICLQKLLNSFQEGNFGRVRGNNKLVYSKTIEDYLSYFRQASIIA